MFHTDSARRTAATCLLTAGSCSRTQRTTF